jgi:multidrug resistance efflux pump
VYSEWIGTTVGYIGAQIHSKVTGNLLAQDYKEGALVSVGDSLFEVDPRPFQVVVDQTKAQLHVASAELGQAQADQDAAQAEIDRAEAACVKTNLDAHGLCGCEKPIRFVRARLLPPFGAYRHLAEVDSQRHRQSIERLGVAL